MLDLQGVDVHPLHVSVATLDDRRHAKDVVFHACGVRLPIGAYVPIFDDVWVASPELCFVQMAHSSSFEQAVALGYELCGSYSLAFGDGAGFVQRPPLTTAAKISRFAQRASRLRGRTGALKAIRHVLDGAASPMESVVAMMLCLPPMRGGYGFPPPRLNGEVVLEGRSAGVVESSVLRCDFLWERQKVALEYDSDMFHTGSERIAHDSRRRNALGFAGVKMLTLTKRQLYDAAEMDRVARVLSRALGHRLRASAANAEERRRVLRRCLLG